MPKISLFLFLIVICSISTHVNIAYILIICSLLSLIIGTILGLAQYRIKRLLAYSTISHVGFLLLAIVIVVREKEVAGLTAFLFYIIQYSITNLDTFAILLAFGYLFGKSSREKSYGIYKHRDIINISSLKGVFNKNPILGLSFSFCLFSMAGIPPLIGFFGKYFVLSAAMMKGYYLLSIFGILTSVISAAYYLRIIKVIHFPLENKSKENKNKITVLGCSTVKDLENNKIRISTSHSYIISVLTLFVLLFL
jgi:NADH-ubiquinone oxidoreductase chain 2